MEIPQSVPLPGAVIRDLSDRTVIFTAQYDELETGTNIPKRSTYIRKTDHKRILVKMLFEVGRK